jgi:hypothetical protein
MNPHALASPGYLIAFHAKTKTFMRRTGSAKKWKMGSQRL